MHHRNILYVSFTSRYHDMIRAVSNEIDASTLLTDPGKFQQAINSGYEFDLVIVDHNNVTNSFLSDLNEYVVQNGLIPVLFIEDPARLAEAEFPPLITSDFVVGNASQAEYEMRISRLLWPEDDSESSDVISIDNMTINLATYQVMVDGSPIDLTLMEYSLLSFLATHPGRAYTRETLLHRVWGFEYCGGTRTVDVHVRRVRSKVGPQIAAHIETVRGVGYMFRV